MSWLDRVLVVITGVAARQLLLRGGTKAKIAANLLWNERETHTAPTTLPLRPSKRAAMFSQLVASVGAAAAFVAHLGGSTVHSDRTATRYETLQQPEHPQWVLRKDHGWMEHSTEQTQAQVQEAMVVKMQQESVPEFALKYGESRVDFLVAS